MYRRLGIIVDRLAMHTLPIRPVNRSSFGIAIANRPAKRDERILIPSNRAAIDESAIDQTISLERVSDGDGLARKVPKETERNLDKIASVCMEFRETGDSWTLVISVPAERRPCNPTS